jgi:hypothetical protein
MLTLNEMFKRAPESPSHPRLRDWKRLLERQGVTAEVEVFWPTALGGTQPELYLRFLNNDDSLVPDVVSWDDSLNVWLVERGIRAADEEQEAERFALMLRGGFQAASREFGDGYFNSVLRHVILDSDLRDHAEISEMLRHVHANPVEANKSLDACRRMIEGEVVARAHELTDKLRYDEETAKSILVNALARYLDKRFSIRERRRMGLL